MQLTDGPWNDLHPNWLPDGRIVFVSDRAGYLEEYHEERTETLWIMNADGSRNRFLLDGSSPRWSPDGTRLYVPIHNGVSASRLTTTHWGT